jgi:hypothetical protein
MIRFRASQACLTCEGFMRVRLFVPVALAFLLVSAGHAQAPYQETRPDDPYTPDYVQDRVDWTDDVPAHIAVVDGAVYLERDGRAGDAEENTPLLAGDRLRTERGRVEVLFADGSALDVDQYSSVDLLSDALMRLLAGRIRLSIARATGDIEYRIDAEPGSARIRTPGDYRLTLSSNRSAEPELDVAVLRGVVELTNDHGRTLVRAGTHALTTSRLAPSLPYAMNSAAWDAFDRWAEDQRDARLGVESSRYLPADLRYYGGYFDRYGSWDYLPTYGRVWYPRVGVGWRPYHHGRWSFSAFFGWTWIGFDRWSWPTHHYGRWGLSSGRWYWIPERRWAPAWVSWASAPGYVGWCPLGFDNRPVIAIVNLSVRRVDPWLGWTVLPSRSFVPNVVVARAVVSGHSLPQTTWSQFVTRAGSPRIPMAALPRAAVPRAAPVRSPGSRAGYVLPQTRPAPTAPIPTISTEPSPPARAGVPRGVVRSDTTPPGGRPDSRASTATPPAPRSEPPAWSSPGQSRTAPPVSPSDSTQRPRAVPRGVAPEPLDRSNDLRSNDGRLRDVRPAPEVRPTPSEVFRARPRPENLPVDRSNDVRSRGIRPEPEVRPAPPDALRARPREYAPPPVPSAGSDRGWPGTRSRPAAEPPPSAPAARPPSRSGDGGGMSRPQPDRPQAVPRGVARPSPSDSRPSPSARPATSGPPRGESRARSAPPSSSDSGRSGGGSQAVRRRGGG